MMKIHNNLNEILQEKGMSASYLADKCDVSRQTITNIINNHNLPSLLLALKISDFLGISIHRIFYLEKRISKTQNYDK